YFFLAGNGEFQVDGEIIPVKEGTVVRVAPEGIRAVRNNGDTPLIMLCVQYLADSFSTQDTLDGVILNTPVKWE
ncbi:MAG: cupin domain-containing protein, partial [Macellibacteroides fermentans]